MLWNIRDTPRTSTVHVFKSDKFKDLQARAEWVAREFECVACFKFRGIFYETTLHLRKSK